MQSIDIHLAEMSGWRALLGKCQFTAKSELHPLLEEYLVRLLFRTTKSTDSDKLAQAFDPFKRFTDNPLVNSEEFRAIGDHCLVYSGLFPEQAILRNLPISYFVKVGCDAYAEYAQYSDDPVYRMLSTFFVDVMDVLLTLREVEQKEVVIDPLNAYHLWRDTGSAAAWKFLGRHTLCLPGNDVSIAIN